MTPSSVPPAISVLEVRSPIEITGNGVPFQSVPVRSKIRSSETVGQSRERFRTARERSSVPRFSDVKLPPGTEERTFSAPTRGATNRPGFPASTVEAVITGFAAVAVIVTTGHKSEVEVT